MSATTNNASGAREKRGGGVNQCADGRGTFHCVRQPDVERKLRGFADGSGKEQEANYSERAAKAPGFDGHRGGFLEDCDVVDRFKCPEEKQDADGEAEIADTRGDERFLACADGGLLEEPEADQQVAAESHAFPSDEHQNDVAGENQREHEENEKIQVREEAVIALFVRHVTGRVDVDEQADKGDDEQHNDRELVHLKPEVDLKDPGVNPSEVSLGEKRNLVGGKLCEFANGFDGAQE
jgi:hypothetical protein